jgi:hypothetical protein
MSNKETAEFIHSTELGLTEDGMINISSSSNVTFGDANRTLFTAERLLNNVEFDNEEDVLLLQSLPPLTYIDLEN